MALNVQKSKSDRLVCTRISSVSHGKSVQLKDALNAIIFSLETAELPSLETKLKNAPEDSLEIQKQLVHHLEAQLAEYKEQEEMQYELLETKKYTQELFDRRNAALREKIEICEKQLKEAKENMPEVKDYAAAVIRLKNAIAALKDETLDAQTKNNLLKAAVEKIVYKPAPIQNTRGTTDFTLDITLRV